MGKERHTSRRLRGRVRPRHCTRSGICWRGRRFLYLCFLLSPLAFAVRQRAPCSRPRISYRRIRLRRFFIRNSFRYGKTSFFFPKRAEGWREGKAPDLDHNSISVDALPQVIISVPAATAIAIGFRLPWIFSLVTSDSFSIISLLLGPQSFVIIFSSAQSRSMYMSAFLSRLGSWRRKLHRN